MQIQLTQEPLEQIEADALLITAFEEDPPQLGGSVGEWVTEVYASGEFKGKALDLTALPRPEGYRARRLALAGSGKKEKFDAAEYRKITGAVIRALKNKGVKRVALALPANRAVEEMAYAATQGAILGDYEPDRHKTDKKDVNQVETLLIAGEAQLGEAVERARTIGESQNFARDLVNEPSNLLPPTALAARAREMAAETGLDCEVLDQDRMRQLGMGSLLGVAQGSAEPPALIVLRYKPEGAAEGGPHLGFIGKGVTFDSGGLSIKPAEGMEKMKYDMAGGAAVIGAMRALAQLKPPVAVTALVPSVENMTGSRAQRPGDIVKSLSGKTIEVLNTDAEGRLILVDTLTYAQQLGCTHLVNAATLTGAIVVALGHVHIGAFTNNDELLGRVLEASKAEGEKMWHMPLDEEYKEYLKSAFADMPNIGGRWGGAITAAMFLKQWADPAPWVHLDIAGTAWLDDAKPHLAKGPSGVTVRTFVNLAMNWK